MENATHSKQFLSVVVGSELKKKKSETMIHIFKHRKGQTYEQIKLAKNRLFLFTCFNPLSPNSDQHQFSSDSQYPYKVKRLGF